MTPTVGGEELLQVLLGAGVGQVAHKESPRVSQVLLLLVLPERPTLPGSGAVLQRPLGHRDMLLPEHLDIAATCIRNQSLLAGDPK